MLFFSVADVKFSTISQISQEGFKNVSSSRVALVCATTKEAVRWSHMFETSIVQVFVLNTRLTVLFYKNVSLGNESSY